MSRSSICKALSTPPLVARLLRFLGFLTSRRLRAQSRRPSPSCHPARRCCKCGDSCMVRFFSWSDLTHCPTSLCPAVAIDRAHVYLSCQKRAQVNEFLSRTRHTALFDPLYKRRDLLLTLSPVYLSALVRLGCSSSRSRAMLIP